MIDNGYDSLTILNLFYGIFRVLHIDDRKVTTVTIFIVM